MRESLLAATVVAALASAIAVAENAPPDNPAKGTAGVNDKMNSSATQGGAMRANPAPGTAPRAAAQDVPMEGPNFTHVQNTDMLSSNVIGLDIYNGQNDKIGKIQDVAFDASKQVTATFCPSAASLEWARTMSRSIRARSMSRTTPKTRSGGQA